MSISLRDETTDEDLSASFIIALRAMDAWADRYSFASRQESLPYFLSRAVQLVPYYRNYFGGVIPKNLGLEQFPVVSRSDFQLSGDPFRADLGEAPTFFAYTNGTIAPKLRISLDEASWFHFNFGTFAAAVNAHQQLLQNMEPAEYGIFAVSNMPNYVRTSVIIPSVRCTLLRMLIMDRSDNDDAELVTYLRSVNVPLLYGRPSNLVQLSELDARISPSGRISSQAILVSGENLYDDDRRIIEQWFGSPLYNAYITTEGGLMALECSYRTGLHVQGTTTNIELLDDNGKITTQGTGEILLTNRFNWCHFFIRYLIGDRATIEIGSCPCGHQGATITQIWGREAEKFDTCIGQIEVSSFGNIFASLPVKQYQVLQVNDRRFIVKWIPQSPRPQEIAETGVSISLGMQQLNRSLEFEVIPVHRINRVDGKLRRFVRAR